jgi:hypothetical protein
VAEGVWSHDRGSVARLHGDHQRRREPRAAAQGCCNFGMDSVRLGILGDVACGTQLQVTANGND